MSEDIQQDGVLTLCNETELLGLARQQGLGRLKRGIPIAELIDIVRGAVAVQPAHHSETILTRKMLQDFINKNWGRLRSQLPGCDGQCETFPCTEGKHALCLFPNKALLQ
jgi:hypothetical protein